MGKGVDSLRRLVEQHGDMLPVLEACLEMAREERSDLDPSVYFRQIEAWAARARRSNASDVGESVRHVLFAQEGFRGSRDAWSRPESSLVDRVLDSRHGLPITLSIVYVEVARAAGLDAFGIGFPAHFLVRERVGEVSRFVDPFARGMVRSEHELPAFLRQVSGGAESYEPWMIEPSMPKTTLLRVLMNLKVTYLRRSDLLGAISTLDRMVVLDPSNPELWKERGLSYARIGLASAALKDLEKVQRVSTPTAADELEVVIQSLRRAVMSMN
ncbi:MAG: tetratricopeptide repeat protein [Myxococcales bacterium]|nr:tetratricopeptide repeat protein [Myxococcales bacterium]